VLTITVLGKEYFDDSKNEFLTRGDVVFELEHSLVSLSKWESIFEKPFLAMGEKTTEEVLGYIEAMVLTPNIPPGVFSKLSDKNYEEIQQYIDAKRSATWFSEFDTKKGRSPEIITSELIYYWMVAFNIPFECQHWHLNRLLNLVRICEIKNSKPKKMSKAELVARNREINERRLKELGTSG
jgi:hypothetical protein